MNVYGVFVDLTKGFDTVNMEAFFIILPKHGCPRQFTNFIHLFQDGMKGLILSTRDASTPFDVINGVKRGCVLVPVLFNLFFTCVLTHVIHDFESGVYLRYRLAGTLCD